MVGDMQIAASDVSQALLDITGEALMNGNFDAFAEVFHTPQHMATMAGPVYMETKGDLSRAFHEMHAHLKALGVTDMPRKCVEASYTSPTRVEATHISELIRNGTRLKDPAPGFSILEKIEGSWKVTKSEYALEPNDGRALAIAHADSKRRSAGTQ